MRNFKNIFLERIDIILCVEISVNTIQFYVFTLNRIKLFLSKLANKNKKTCTGYSKIFNANDSSMNGTCNTYVQYSAQKT